MNQIVQPTRPSSILLLCLFICSRILYLTFLNPYYFAQFHYEELHLGLISLEFWKGLNFPFFDYRPDDYSGAWIFIGGFGSLFFRLLEPSVFSLKLVALIFSSAAFYCWIKILENSKLNKSILIFACFFIFAPPSFLNKSVTTIGDMGESIFITSIAFLLYIKNSRKKYTHFLLGLLLGFGIWFNYFISLSLLTLLICVGLDKKLNLIKSKTFYLSVLGFIVGLSPWFFINHLNTTSPFEVHGRPLLSHFNLNFLIENFRSYRKNIFFDLAESFTPAYWGINFTLKKICMLFYSFLIFSPIFAAIILKKLNPPKFITIYIILTLSILAISDFREIRFFIPLFPFLFALSAYSVASITEKFEKQSQLLRYLFIASIIGASFIGTLPFLSFHHTGAVFKAKGYNYQFIDTHVCKNSKKCLANYNRVCKNIPSEDCHQFSTSLALQIIDELPLKYPGQELDQYQIPKNFEPYIYYFLGKKILSIKQTIDGSLRTLSSLNVTGVEKLAATRGIFDSAGSLKTHDLHDIESNVSEKMIPAYWRSRGEAWAYFKYQRDQEIKNFNKQPSIPEKYKNFYLQGIGKALYHLWSNRPLDPYYDPNQLASIFPQNELPNLFKGIGLAWAEREFEWRIAGFNWYWKEFAEDLTKQHQQAILEGRKEILIFFRDLTKSVP